MKRSLTLWVAAFAATVASAVFQRLTGPTYPLRGGAKVAGREISFSLERSGSSVSGAAVSIPVPDSSFSGMVRWRPLGSRLPWTNLAMSFVAETRRADIPPQPPLTKLEYSVELTKDGASVSIPPIETVPIRFKGDVPAWVLIPHVLAMFLSMLISTRCGLQLLSSAPSLKRLTYWTLATLFIGGFVFGPLMSYYAFDLFWTGWPVGRDITDNKTLIAFVGWLLAAALLKKPRFNRWAVLAASVVMLGVFLIPHSV